MDIQLFKLETECIMGLVVQPQTFDLLHFKEKNKYKLIE